MQPRSAPEKKKNEPCTASFCLFLFFGENYQKLYKPNKPIDFAEYKAIACENAKRSINHYQKTYSQNRMNHATPPMIHPLRLECRNNDKDLLFKSKYSSLSEASTLVEEAMNQCKAKENK